MSINVCCPTCRNYHLTGRIIPRLSSFSRPCGMKRQYEKYLTQTETDCEQELPTVQYNWQASNNPICSNIIENVWQIRKALFSTDEILRKINYLQSKIRFYCISYVLLFVLWKWTFVRTINHFPFNVPKI